MRVARGKRASLRYCLRYIAYSGGYPFALRVSMQIVSVISARTVPGDNENPIRTNLRRGRTKFVRRFRILHYNNALLRLAALFSGGI